MNELKELHDNLYNIMLADDHFLFRQDLKKILNKHKNIRVVGEANNGLELLEILQKRCPHLVILDISMPDMNGIEAAREIARRHPDVCVLILTMHKSSEYFNQAVSAGVSGYLLKEDIYKDIFSAITSIKSGGVYFPRDFRDEV